MNLHNIFFGILLAVGLAVGVYAVGLETFMDEARSLVGMEDETVFVRPPVTAEETPQAAPVNPAPVPAEEPTVAPEITQASAFDPQGLRFGSGWSPFESGDDGRAGLEVYASSNSTEPMEWNLSDEYFQFPDDAYAEYEFQIAIRNTTDTSITVPVDAVSLRFLDTTAILATGYPLVAGPYYVKHIEAYIVDQDGAHSTGITEGGSMTIPPMEPCCNGYDATVWFSVPVKDVDLRAVVVGDSQATVYFGDIGPQWANFRLGNTSDSNCYKGLYTWSEEPCDY